MHIKRMLLNIPMLLAKRIKVVIITTIVKLTLPYMSIRNEAKELSAGDANRNTWQQ